MRVHILRIPVTMLLLMCVTMLTAQSIEQIATDYLSANKEKYSVTPSVKWRTLSSIKGTNGIAHTYLNQTYQGIDIKDQVVSVAINRNEVHYVSGKFIGAADRYLSNQQSIGANAALSNALNSVSLSSTMPITPLETSTDVDETTTYNLSDIAIQDVIVRKRYFLAGEKDMRLVWEVDIYQKDAQHWWAILVDAGTGEILRTLDQVISCDFSHEPTHEDVLEKIMYDQMTCEEQRTHLLKRKATASCTHAHHNHSHTSTAMANGASVANSYLVFPLGIEHPNIGPQVSVTNPELDNTTASPNGWHTRAGNTFSQFTRGNNVDAYEDQNNSNNASSGNGSRSDGGATLDFNYPFDPNTAPTTGVNRDAAITNLFYWSNITHDIWYNYGFDEASGNYQDDNYGRGGTGGDEVQAEAQDAFNSGTRNNANFAPGTDGNGGRMQMYLWNPTQTTSFTVNAPAPVAGGYQAVLATFGPQTVAPVTGNVVIVTDGTGGTSEACNANPYTNGAALNGNVALIDRGNCSFVEKVQNAESDGAIAVIICNNIADTPFAMGGADPGIGIPSIMISQGNCATIRAQAGLNVTISSTPGSVDLDGDFDNGIIAHEYGHGISTRLVGGRNSSCLNTNEQMGEGWSDFFGLVMTVRPGDDRNTLRPVGSYASGNPGGIRTYPYTFDMSVNSHTYANINGESIPHGVGSVWCAMLWDMHWLLADSYGYSFDLYDASQSEGNIVAMNLVIEGLKNMSCSPGFIDGRDAIIAADNALYGGMHLCEIWEAFARRGLGENASQGSANSVTDSVEDFNAPANLSASYTIDKTADKSVASCNETITYTVTVASGVASACASAATNLSVLDDLPAGLSYVNGSATGGASYDASNNTLSWNIPSLTATQTYTYQATVDCNSVTTATTPGTYSDDVEAGQNALLATSNTSNISNWTISTAQSNSGGSAWFAEELEATNFGQTTENQYLTLGAVNLGCSSEFKFFHLYDTEINWDGGQVDISTDGGTTWVDLGTNMVTNGYNNYIEDNNSIAAFSGNSNGWIQTVIDLSAYAGNDALIRFDFYYDALEPGNGWYIDDIELTGGGAIILPNVATVTEGGNSLSATACVDVTLKEVCVSPKVFLQGPLSGTTMATALNTNTLIPTTSPYNSTESYTGGFPANAVDWVEVEIRSDNSATPATSHKKSAILLNDGTVVSPDGSPVCFPEDPGTSWYIVIQHRNHLGIMTANPVLLN